MLLNWITLYHSKERTRGVPRHRFRFRNRPQIPVAYEYYPRIYQEEVIQKAQPHHRGVAVPFF